MDAHDGAEDRIAGAVYLGERDGRARFRLTLPDGQQATALWPERLVDRRGPYAIKHSAIALGEKWLPPSMRVGKPADAGEQVEKAID